jgi:hypothetical protein
MWLKTNPKRGSLDAVYLDKTGSERSIKEIKERLQKQGLLKEESE